MVRIVAVTLFSCYICCLLFLQGSVVLIVGGIEILSKSKLERSEKVSNSNESLNCTRKIVLNMAVPSGSRGGEASVVAEIVEVEGNSTNNMQTLRMPPVLTVNKSAAYALYELTYMKDVAYRPQEYYIKTQKCEPDAGADVVKICERLHDENAHIIEHTEVTIRHDFFLSILPEPDHTIEFTKVQGTDWPDFDKLMKGKSNTAHCIRFPGEWFHVFGIGQRSIGFNVRIEVKTGSKVSEVIVGPENRTATSKDNFFRGKTGLPQGLGMNISMWMLLERVRFTLDGVECNKIGVSYEAFNTQPNFCSSPFWSCLHNQLWNFWDADQNRISRKQSPLYGLQGRFERINQHPNAGTHSFSIGITEVLNTNLLIELTADNIEYVYQRSPGKILSVTVPTFEALTQFGIATITTKNAGEVEASYSLTFDCSKGVALMDEQFFIMKPNEIASRSFKLYPTTDQAAKYVCSAILKDSNFNEADRAECLFSTTATILDNGSQIVPFQPPKNSVNGFFESIEETWNSLWEGFLDFITGKSCRRKCSGFFDFGCHVQYICMSWMVMFGLLLAIFPTVLVLLWLLHQKGFFDPIYEWWEDLWYGKQKIRYVHRSNAVLKRAHNRVAKHHGLGGRRLKHDAQHKRKSSDKEHRHRRGESDTEYNNHLHQVHKHQTKHRSNKKSNMLQQTYWDEKKIDLGQHKHTKERKM